MHCEGCETRSVCGIFPPLQELQATRQAAHSRRLPLQAWEPPLRAIPAPPPEPLQVLAKLLVLAQLQAKRQPHRRNPRMQDQGSWIESSPESVQPGVMCNSTRTPMAGLPWELLDCWRCS